MLLTADIGNTNIVLALLDEKDRVVSQCRVPSGETLPPEAYDDAIRRVTGLEALVVGPTTPAGLDIAIEQPETCLLYTSPSPRDGATSRMPSSA